MSRDPARDPARDVAERYARRGAPDRYAALRPDVWKTLHERQRALFALLAAAGWQAVGDKRVVEVGCGSGGNLLELLRLGFAPEHLTGIELLADRHAQARRVLPEATAVLLGDACDAPIAPASQHLVLQATVFSSLLDADAERRLAAAMWSWLAPGGAVLWYDFTVDNPRNPDVRGVPLRRIRELFPHAARLRTRRITLAPPLARRVCALHPALYGALAWLLPLRTHLLAWIEKP